MNPPADLPSEPNPTASSTAPAASAAPASGSVVDPSQLTPEEQMALFEKDLKENDWGHQPC